MFENISFLNQGEQNFNNIGQKLFYLGLFFLPTAPSIGALILFLSLFLSKNNNPIFFIREKSNLVFILISFLMILSCIYNTFDNTNFVQKDIRSLSWISLINWIPFFWCYWGFQPYLQNDKQKKMVAKILVIGTIPMIISGLLQSFFDVTGPFEIFNGLIIWYQRPLSITDGLTGPFNNPNYAGSWLAIVWPFAIYLFISNKKISKKLCTTIICLLFIVCLLLTNSRNSWIGMFITIQIMFGFETILLVIPLLVLSIFLLTFLISVIPISIRDTLTNLLPINILNNFPDNSVSLTEAYPRLGIWKFSIDNILERPLFGWGGGSFPIVYETSKNNWIGHPHNIIFEIAFNYGLLTALLICSKIFKSLYKFYKSIANYDQMKIIRGKKNLIFEKAWFASILFLTYSHLFDMHYFDLRISIVSWILLSGLRASNDLKLE